MNYTPIAICWFLSSHFLSLSSRANFQSILLYHRTHFIWCNPPIFYIAEYSFPMFSQHVMVIYPWDTMFSYYRPIIEDNIFSQQTPLCIAALLSPHDEICHLDGTEMMMSGWQREMSWVMTVNGTYSWFIVKVSIYIYIHLYLYLYLNLNLYLYLYLYLSICLSVCLSINLSI